MGIDRKQTIWYGGRRPTRSRKEIAPWKEKKKENDARIRQPASRPRVPEHAEVLLQSSVLERGEGGKGWVLLAGD